MLGKLHITSEAESEKLKELYDCVVEVVGSKMVMDALSKSAINKLEQNLAKIVSSLDDD
jgi:hypothetical protein